MDSKVVVLKFFPTSKEELHLDSIDTKKLNPSVRHLFEEVTEESLRTIRNASESDEGHQMGCYVQYVMQRIESLLSYVWEQLHTGEWKNVDVAWRQLYSYTSLFKAAVCLLSNEGDLKQLLCNSLKACDMGLIMGEPILDGLLCKVADHLNEALITLSEAKKPRTEQKIETEPNKPVLNPTKAVATFHQPSVERFLSDIMNKKPAIFTGVMDYWPAMSSESRWSIDYLKKIAGYRTVPIEIGSKYTDDAWSQSLTTVNEFIDEYILAPKKSSTGYLAQYQLFHQIPRLQEDIITPDYCYVGESDDVQVNVWFGPKGTISPLHHDPDHNFLCQVVGSKYIRLYEESVSALLYPHEGLLSNTSRVDVEEPDTASFPLFPTAPYVECVLEPGNILYLPPRMWHYVRSLSTSFSVSFWWK